MNTGHRYRFEKIKKKQASNRNERIPIAGLFYSKPER